MLQTGSPGSSSRARRLPVTSGCFANLEKTRATALYLSQRLLLALVETGLTREAAYQPRPAALRCARGTRASPVPWARSTPTPRSRGRVDASTLDGLFDPRARSPTHVDESSSPPRAAVLATRLGAAFAEGDRDGDAAVEPGRRSAARRGQGARHLRARRTTGCTSSPRTASPRSTSILPTPHPATRARVLTRHLGRTGSPRTRRARPELRRRRRGSASNATELGLDVDASSVGRSMVVRRAEPVKVECVVRGYHLRAPAGSDYQRRRARSRAFRLPGRGCRESQTPARADRHA